jgi:hypothetical protein
MTVFKSRGEIAQAGDVISLRVQFRGSDGNPSDTDIFPEISIQEPSGNVIMNFTSQGVYRLGTGLYGYDFKVEYNSSYGVWTDIWRGNILGFQVYSTTNFVIMNSEIPKANTDGYIALGDDVPFDYSQNALLNVNKLIKTVKARLNSSGKALVKDQYGNDMYVDCDIFTVEQLATFVANSLSAFNEIPHFTAFTFEDTEILSQFHDVIAQHAVIYALASKQMLEKGRELNITDNGLGLTPPGVSDVLGSQYSTELTNWFEKVKLIKANMKSAPLGLGTLRTTSASPQVMRLRHLRARQIF